jgi:hypothetical protein
MLSIIEYLLYKWTRLQARGSQVGHQSLYFAFRYNFLEFQHFKQTISTKKKLAFPKKNLTIAEHEKKGIDRAHFHLLKGHIFFKIFGLAFLKKLMSNSLPLKYAPI